MVGIGEIRKLIVERLHVVFPQATDWQELTDAQVARQTVDLLVRFRLAGEAKALICTIRPAAQPRHVREVVTRLRELRGLVPGAYPVLGAPYVSPQSAGLVRQNGIGYVDLAGNCYLAFDSILVEKEGKPNTRLVRRPLKRLFSPRATRVVRALLCQPDRSWRLGELGREVGVSLGHAHNVVTGLEELTWVERGPEGRIRLVRPGELLDAWRDEYSYRTNGLAAFVAPVTDKRRIMEALAHRAAELGLPYAFSLHAGASLIGPQVRVATVHCYVGGDPEPLVRVLGLQPVDGEGAVYLLTPYDHGVFYAPVVKGGLRIVCLPQLYVDLYHHERRGREQAAKLRRDAMRV